MSQLQTTHKQLRSKRGCPRTAHGVCLTQAIQLYGSLDDRPSKALNISAMPVVHELKSDYRQLNLGLVTASISCMIDSAVQQYGSKTQTESLPHFCKVYLSLCGVACTDGQVLTDGHCLHLGSNCLWHDTEVHEHMQNTDEDQEDTTSHLQRRQKPRGH